MNKAYIICQQGQEYNHEGFVDCEGFSIYLDTIFKSLDGAKEKLGQLNQ
jgi:hypothetical protein